MSKLPERTRLICVDIMDKLMVRPCAAMFMNPVDPENDDAPNYHTVVKHPIDLTHIYKKLSGNEYTSITQWDKDMNLIWNNAEKFYNKGSMPAILAGELKRRYDKEYQRIKLLKLPTWSRVVFGFKAKLEDLFENIPPVVGAMCQFSDGDQTKPFSEEELSIFIRMCLYLQNTQDSQKMAQIIQYYQPDCKIEKGTFEIDVNDLEIPTLHALRDFVTFRLAEMNILYPK